jgi:hypothetical protein
MAILSTPVITRPNQQLQTGPIDELTIEEFTGVVEGVIARKAKLDPYIKRRQVKGTNTLTNYAVGETSLDVLTPGEAPEGKPVDFSKISLVIDTVVIARNIIPLLEDFQNNFGARQKVGLEHGKVIAKFSDQSFMIQGIKAARLAASAYGAVDGFAGGSKVTLTAAGDALDPAKLYKAFADLLVQMEEKDVEPQSEDVIIIVRPKQFYALQQAEQIVNGEYITSEGNKLTGVAIFKAWGCPVVSSNNLPNTVITGHKLSKTSNGNAYDGDFTKVVALAISPRALLAGETIPLTSKVWFDDLSKQWYIDSWLAYGVTPDRAEFAGVIELP